MPLNATFLWIFDTYNIKVPGLCPQTTLRGCISFLLVVRKTQWENSRNPTYWGVGKQWSLALDGLEFPSHFPP